MKLSHTKVSKYSECPARYDFHYNKKFRTRELSSALWFGSALDEAFNCLLLQKKKEFSNTEKEMLSKGAVQLFLDKIETFRFNGEDHIIRDYPFAKYSLTDLDSKLFDEDTLQIYNKYTLLDNFNSLDDFTAFTDGFMSWYKDAKEVSKTDQKTYLLLNWLSLRTKGLLLIESYKKEVIPLIDEVISIQEGIRLPNDDGDEIEGFIDFIATFTDDPDTVYLCDNKTSAKPYKQSDLTESEQLNLYAYYKNIKKVAYVVVEKNIRKRDPKVRINIIKGDANLSVVDTVLDKFENTLLNIRGEKFSPNFNSGCFFYGNKCEYYSICHADKMPDNVVNTKKRKKDEDYLD